MNFEKLIATKHMLQWFSDKPFEDIAAKVEQMFSKQSPNTKLLAFEVTSDPQWLTAAKKGDNDEQVILVRAGLAFTCDFILQDDNGSYNLQGVFTWVAVNLDTRPKLQTWMDLDGTLQEFGVEGWLKDRIYQ